VRPNKEIAMRSLLLLVACLFVATAAGAHPGHGQAGDPFGAVHYLSEPVHALGGIALVCVALLSAYLLHRRTRTVARCMPGSR
jgi:hypothetical protein